MDSLDSETLAPIVIWLGVKTSAKWEFQSALSQQEQISQTPNGEFNREVMEISLLRLQMGST